jgi:hypothetical protein
MVRAIALLGIIGACAWSQNSPSPIRGMWAPSMSPRVPGFYNGYLFWCEPHNFLTLYSPEGSVALTLEIQGRGNGYASIQSIAIDSDGRLAVGWSDLPDAGIDIRDMSGKIIRSIDTGRYVPAHLSFGEDHSLWTFGWQRDTTDPYYREKKDYLTLKKYSPGGEQVRAYLWRSFFPAGMEPGGYQWQERRITVTSNRVGIEALSGTDSGQREWVELDLSGNVVGRWRLDRSYEFPGVVLTADNRAYVHRFDAATKSRQVLRLNRDKAQWELLKSPSNAALYGSDGDKLVFWDDGSGGAMHMSWYPQPDSSSTAKLGN